MITRTVKTLAAFLLATTAVIADPVNPSRSIFDHLSQGAVLEISIETDLAELIGNRRTEDYLPATFNFEDADGQVYTQEIKVKPRGRFRRRACNFPPVMLNFSKGTLREQGYAPEYDKLKLVTHCIDDKSDSKDQVIREYLAYKLYNELTEQSYRVQLARITYIDSKGELSKIKRYGFLIEDTDEMAHRLGGEECEDCHNLASSRLDLVAENRLAVFQYMIGNTDWDISMIRNVKLVKPIGGGPAIPVPYDFDFAGMVEAPYAIPNSEIGQMAIKQRVFQGRQVDRSLFEATLRHFLSRQELLLEQVESFKGLSWQSRQSVAGYLNTFFSDAEMTLAGESIQDSSLREAFLELKREEEVQPATGASLGK